MPVKDLTYGSIEFALDDKSIVNLSFNTANFRKDWERCGVFVNEVSDFMEPVVVNQYLSGFSFALNELVENVVKYSKFGGDRASIDINVKQDSLYMSVTNEVTEKQWESFRNMVHEYANRDIDELYRFALNRNESKMLGLILLQKDPTIILDTEFTNRNDQFYVTIRLSMNMGNGTHLV